jgi:hypothetical protein
MMIWPGQFVGKMQSGEWKLQFDWTSGTTAIHRNKWFLWHQLNEAQQFDGQRFWSQLEGMDMPNPGEEPPMPTSQMQYGLTAAAKKADTCGTKRAADERVEGVSQVPWTARTVYSKGVLKPARTVAEDFNDRSR